MIPNVLSIAGSDPSGGAGIQADLKTFAALGCHGMAAVTALTAQNTCEVTGVHAAPPAFVALQVETVFADVRVAAVKIGMLGSAALASAVAGALRPHCRRLDPRRFGGLPVVLDPVLVATSGAALGDDAVVAAIRSELLPLATLVTPNAAEAERLDGRGPLQGREAIEAAARRLRGDDPAAWLLKGGHGGGDTADDLLLDDEGARWFSSPRQATRNTHGTGCTLSSAIAALLARGQPRPQAVAQAKRYRDAALAGADRLAGGHGAGPVDHFAAWRS